MMHEKKATKIGDTRCPDLQAEQDARLNEHEQDAILLNDHQTDNLHTQAQAEAEDDLLPAEIFLREHYEFRYNVLADKIEVRARKDDAAWHTLDKMVFNSIVVAARRAMPKERGLKSQLQDSIYSSATPAWNPIAGYLHNLPRWDGRNRVVQLLLRIPGITAQQIAWAHVWMLSMVAHWLQLDQLHANELVLTLIGAQGCGKSTFLRRLLPEHLREYYLDHVNLGNKFDKEMALTNNLLVNLDELDAIRPSQHAALKQTLSKSKVNGRPIYGASQEDRARYASFVATTNNPHPLTDATGSRRYICLQIPDGQYINNVGEIDYDQLYAQVLHEVQDEKAPYWFTNEEVARIQELNQNYMEQKDMAEIVKACFRKPEEGENVEPLKSSRVLELIKHSFPSLPINSRVRIQLGFAMKELGFENVHYGNVVHYKAVPKKTA